MKGLDPQHCFLTDLTDRPTCFHTKTLSVIFYIFLNKYHQKTKINESIDFFFSSGFKYVWCWAHWLLFAPIWALQLGLRMRMFFCGTARKIRINIPLRIPSFFNGKLQRKLVQENLKSLVFIWSQWPGGKLITWIQEISLKHWHK